MFHRLSSELTATKFPILQNSPRFRMSKRALTPTEATETTAKKTRISKTFAPNKISTAQAAAVVDANPPLEQLNKLLDKMLKKPAKGDSVVYWMRMADLRSAFD